MVRTRVCEMKMPIFSAKNRFKKVHLVLYLTCIKFAGLIFFNIQPNRNNKRIQLSLNYKGNKNTVYTLLINLGNYCFDLFLEGVINRENGLNLGYISINQRGNPFIF
uniref:Uncharacterized protein n=1 Tax=Meloidogyne enterolobii TaxID=390850 RepID=A0A6V7TN17_MELEN|nr:unnamed protein product [Meloidogyne enterolobii]